MTGADLLAMIKKQPIAFGAGLVFIVCLVVYYFEMDAVTDARTTFEEKDTQARRIAENVRHANGLAEQTAEMQELGKQFDARMVRASQLATNLQFFYRLENETGVKLLDVRQNPVAPVRAKGPKSAYVAVPFSVNVEGTYPQILAFLRRVEAGPGFARFATVTVNKSVGPRGGEAMQSDRLTASFTVEMLGQP